MKVMKFGGTSVGKPERMHQVSQLITKDAEPTITVLSALSGTTNSLVEISNHLSQSDRIAAKASIDRLEAHYRKFVGELVNGEASGTGRIDEYQIILCVSRRAGYRSFIIACIGIHEHRCK